MSRSEIVRTQSNIRAKITTQFRVHFQALSIAIHSNRILRIRSAFGRSDDFPSHECTELWAIPIRPELLPNEHCAWFCGRTARNGHRNVQPICAFEYTVEVITLPFGFGCFIILCPLAAIANDDVSVNTASPTIRRTTFHGSIFS